ncbi:MAG: CinA family protein [Epsilonproteobacteria bacterium]|nr:hypothetical protein [Campylobacterota bacterium]NPA56717.1 CinA family protein [Campylobacterota bacterium]
MGNGLIMVGREFAINRGFVDYVEREAVKRLSSLERILFLEERDKEVLVEITRAQKELERLLVVASPSSYSTISKVVATLFDDHLVLRDGELVPSKAHQFGRGSFLIGNVNLVRGVVGQRLPELFLSVDREEVSLFAIDLPLEQFERGALPLARESGIEYRVTWLTQELMEVRAVEGRYGDLSKFVHEIKGLFPDTLIVAHNLFEYIIEGLFRVGKSLVFAESCTGGLLSSMLTSIPGSSRVFKGGFVTYANEMKEEWLGVKRETLLSHGAVSEETVREMVAGALARSGADYAVAISGIAGPGGGTPTKPVGTVVIGSSSREGREIVRTLHFQGDRNYIQYQAALYGVKLLLEVGRRELF